MKANLPSLLAIAASLVLAACNSGKDKLDELTAIEKKVCACADAACVHAAVPEMNAWSAKAKGAKVSHENYDKIQASSARLVACAKAKGEPDADKLDDELPQSE